MPNNDSAPVAAPKGLETLKRSEELLRAVFNASPRLVCVSTIFGEFVEANEAFCAACGLGREQIIGKANSASNLWVDLKKREEFLVLLGQRGAVSCFKADMRHADGSIRNCLLSAQVIKVGATPLVLTTAEDITKTCKE